MNELPSILTGSKVIDAAINDGLLSLTVLKARRRRTVVLQVAGASEVVTTSKLQRVATSEVKPLEVQ